MVVRTALAARHAAIGKALTSSKRQRLSAKAKTVRASHLGLLRLWARETPLRETAQHQERLFSSATTLLLVALEHITDDIALVRCGVYPGVGVARTEGKSSVKPESEPEEFGRQNLLVFRKGLQAASAKEVFKTCHFHEVRATPWHSASSRVNPLTVLYLGVLLIYDQTVSPAASIGPSLPP